MQLSDFGWKGTATRQGITSSEFDGRQYDGLISGTARVRWGSNWTAEGEVRARGLKVAVFAPTLVSEGKVEGRGNYTMSGAVPAKLGESARVEGSFKIENGVIGNFDLTRALQTGGAQSAGRTPFGELTGQGIYDRGGVQLRNIAVALGNAPAHRAIVVGYGPTGRTVTRLLGVVPDVFAVSARLAMRAKQGPPRTSSSPWMCLSPVAESAVLCSRSSSRSPSPPLSMRD